MGIYISRMEMPKEGDLIVIRPDGKAYYVAENPQNAYEGEAAHVPPHGRLGDLDALEAYLTRLYIVAFREGNGPYHLAYKSLAELVSKTLTVIPAEER